MTSIRRLSLATAAVLAAMPALAQTPQQRPEVAAAAQRLRADVVELRRWFHTNPELSNREVQTAAKFAEHLAILRVDVPMLARR